jgi:hypothetical protein
VTADRSAESPICPGCMDGKGDARAVEIKSHQRTVVYECDHCHHKWSVTSPDPPVRRRIDGAFRRTVLDGLPGL